MIIDSHQHVFWHGRDDADLIANMDEQGIDIAWLLTCEISPEENNSDEHQFMNPLNVRQDGTHEGILLSDLLKAKEHYPDRFILGYCPHPMVCNAAVLFEAAYNIYGVQICGEWKCRMLLDDPRCLELFRKAGQLKCPVVLHLQWPYLHDLKTGKEEYQQHWYGGTADNLERALQACTQTVFIGHGQGFWTYISGDAESTSGSVRSGKGPHPLSGTGLLLDENGEDNWQLYPSGPVQPGGRLYELFEKYPNLYADLSAGSALNALKRDPAHAVEFLIRFGDRLLFARDFYGGEPKTFLNSLNLPEKVYQKLYFQNARKLVDIR